MECKVFVGVIPVGPDFASPTEVRRLRTPHTMLRSIQMIRKLTSGKYRLYSEKKDPKTGKRKNLGTFDTREAAQKHEREVKFFKRRK